MKKISNWFYEWFPAIVMAFLLVAVVAMVRPPV